MIIAKSGTTGILYQINTRPDVDKFIRDAPSQQYAVVMPYSLFVPYVACNIHDQHPITFDPQ